MRNSRLIGRAVGFAAVLVAVVAVATLLLGGNGGDYRVKARFQNASQLVKGNLVQVAGKSIGSVEQIDLTPDGQAELTLRIDEDYAPLRRGTLATVRASSLSGIANRYIDLRLPPGNARAIPDGGVIEQSDTTTAVDLDELFNVFGPKERKALTNVIRGSGTQYAGRGVEANRGWRYLNPSLAASSRLFRELNRDTRLFERFVVSSSQLVTDVAERRDDLAGLIRNLSATTGALGARNRELAESVNQLPDFMRRANTTFLNLRATLDDLRPLVDESKPVAKKLRPFLHELRFLAEGAEPTIRDLSRLVRSSGGSNDLIELTKSSVPLRDIAVGTVQANGKSREGAFPASTRALAGATPELASARPYAVDLVGWFDDYSHSGIYDALGGASRVQLGVNAFSVASGALSPIPPELRGAAFEAVATLHQNNRCPGSIERDPGDHSTPFKPSPDFNCDETQVPTGP